MAEPVARMMSIKCQGAKSAPYRFSEGKFYQVMPHAGKGGGRSVPVPVPAVVIREGKVAVAYENMTLNVRDIIKTSPDTVLAIEFLIGGRVGVNKDTSIEIVNERAVADGSNGFKRAIYKNVGLWLKADKLREPLEIQTNGGTLGGIKG